MVGYCKGDVVGTAGGDMLNIEEYLDRVMEAAALTKKDGRRVRGELQSHIQDLLSAGETKGLEESEVVVMIEKEFGNADELGKMIAKAKGRFLTYLKKKTKKIAVTLVVALVVALAIKAVAFEAFHVTGDVASPRVPINSRIMVNKLNDNFAVDDVIVYRPEKGARVGIVKEIDDAKNGVIVTRKGEGDTFVSNDKIVGKAVWLYYCKL